MRPEGWENPYKDVGEGGKWLSYEVGADAMYNALWKLAEQSPTKTFTLDANVTNIFEDKE